MPALDTGIGLFGLGFAALRQSGAIGGLTQNEGLALLAVSATFIVSEVDGYQQVHECREGLEEAAPPPEMPHHHRLPPVRPAPADVTTPYARLAPRRPDSSDTP